VHKRVVQWAPYGVTVIGIYSGGSDHLYWGSYQEQVRDALSRHPAYLASESGTPDEKAILFGYYSPKDRVFYVAREVFPLVADQIDWAMTPGAWA